MEPQEPIRAVVVDDEQLAREELCFLLGQIGAIEVVAQASNGLEALRMPLPRKIKDARPVHPPIAVWAGVNGTVLVEATIDETGRVADRRILQSVPMLDQSAIDALGRWEFAPTTVNGEAVPVTIRVTVDYKSQ